MTYLQTPWTEVTVPLLSAAIRVTPLLLLESLLTCLAFSVVITTTREKRYGWLLNIAKKTMGLCIYYLQSLYVKCTLDLILIIKSFYGWYRWGAKVKNKKSIEPKVTALSVEEIFGFSALGLIGMVVLGFVYGRYLNSSLAYEDGLHASMSLINYYLLAQKKREAWLFSLVGQLVYIHVCYTKGMLFFFKYVLYVFLSIRGFYKWHQAYEKNIRQADAS